MMRSIELDPQNYLAHFRIADIYEIMGKPENALMMLTQPGLPPSSALGVAYAMLGRRADALKVVAGLAKLGFDPQAIALVYFTLGDKDRGFEWLTKVFDRQLALASAVKFDPQFDSVRSDPPGKLLDLRPGIGVMAVSIAPRGPESAGWS